MLSRLYKELQLYASVFIFKYNPFKLAIYLLLTILLIIYLLFIICLLLFTLHILLYLLLLFLICVFSSKRVSPTSLRCNCFWYPCVYDIITPSYWAFWFSVTIHFKMVCFAGSCLLILRHFECFSFIFSLYIEINAS